MAPPPRVPMSPSWSERLGAARCPLGWAGLRVCAWFAPPGTSPGPCAQPCGRPPVQTNSSALLGGASARRREEEHAARRRPRHTPRPPRPPRTTRAASRAQAGGRPPSGKTERARARNGLAREAPRAPLLVAPAVLPPSAQSADRRHQAILQARGATRRTRAREHAGSGGVALWAARGDEAILGVMRGVANVRAVRPFSGAWSLRPPTRSSATRRRSWRRWP